MEENKSGKRTTLNANKEIVEVILCRSSDFYFIFFFILSSFSIPCYLPFSLACVCVSYWFLQYLLLKIEIYKDVRLKPPSLAFHSVHNKHASYHSPRERETEHVTLYEYILSSDTVKSTKPHQARTDERDRIWIYLCSFLFVNVYHRIPILFFLFARSLAFRSARLSECVEMLSYNFLIELSKYVKYYYSIKIEFTHTYMWKKNR